VRDGDQLEVEKKIRDLRKKIGVQQAKKGGAAKK